MNKINELISDGREYLVLISFPNWPCYWEIIKWGTPVGISDSHGVSGWVTNSGFKLKTENCVVEEFHELKSVIQLLRCVELSTRK